MQLTPGTDVTGILADIEPKQRALPYLELDSMMLAQVVEVAQMVSQNDINSTHIQNWVRRKFIPNPIKKKYSREQVANILLINELRNILPLEQIKGLLSFVNQDLLQTDDDRINPTKLYRYYCEIFDRATLDWKKSLQDLEREVGGVLAQEELTGQDKTTVTTTLLILNLLARANFYKLIAEDWLSSLAAQEQPGEKEGRE
ncbi:MAG: DUF1836 domain-containing protein [Peptococcaceae bacterium]|nr:DUF1836 domain-containing protein [Peptococcaceae bacterium]